MGDADGDSPVTRMYSIPTNLRMYNYIFMCSQFDRGFKKGRDGVEPDNTRILGLMEEYVLTSREETEQSLMNCA